MEVLPPSGHVQARAVRHRVLLVACATACEAGTAAPPPPTGFVRVDQIGYRTGEAKQAFLMSPSGDTSFRVVDESGRTVLTGVAGPPTGSWNTEFATIRAMDFSAVKTPGTYRILSGAAAPSPVFRIGSAAAYRDPFRAGADYLGFDAVPHTFGLATTALLHQQTTKADTYAAFGTRQRNWALGANAWGASFVIGAGSVSPRCPEHQVANLTGGQLTGAAVNGPNSADRFAELNRFPTMRPCVTEGFTRFDGHGARFVDDVGAWQSVEPADDFTATALLTFALASR
ncbi:glycoside hydrolase family 9 protein [Amycolatopsis balhimycina]|uniref:glycoside hydrolase family 9 protein n=1 Tax=Amycolatopsis balhimycina TaxID=208443 RepID=UPI00248190EA|nr:glycoside hydrolase family 9 protein [Amycolatopsis balhimycina]